MERWERREKKRNKKKNGMRVTNRSIFIIKEQIEKRSRDAKKKREQERKFFVEDVNEQSCLHTHSTRRL